MPRSFKEIPGSLRGELRFQRSLVWDPRTPLASEVLLGLAIGSALLPFDLIPDGIPIVGCLDDVVVIPLLALAGLGLVPDEVQDEGRRVVRGSSGLTLALDCPRRGPHRQAFRFHPPRNPGNAPSDRYRYTTNHCAEAG